MSDSELHSSKSGRRRHRHKHHHRSESGTADASEDQPSSESHRRRHKHRSHRHHHRSSTKTSENDTELASMTLAPLSESVADGSDPMASFLSTTTTTSSLKTAINNNNTTEPEKSNKLQNTGKSEKPSSIDQIAQMTGNDSNGPGGGDEFASLFSAGTSAHVPAAERHSAKVAAEQEQKAKEQSMETALAEGLNVMKKDATNVEPSELPRPSSSSSSISSSSSQPQPMVVSGWRAKALKRAGGSIGGTAMVAAEGGTSESERKRARTGEIAGSAAAAAMMKVSDTVTSFIAPSGSTASQTPSVPPVDPEWAGMSMNQLKAAQLRAKLRKDTVKMEAVSEAIRRLAHVQGLNVNEIGSKGHVGGLSGASKDSNREIVPTVFNAQGVPMNGPGKPPPLAGSLAAQFTYAGAGEDTSVAAMAAAERHISAGDYEKDFARALGRHNAAVADVVAAGGEADDVDVGLYDVGRDKVSKANRGLTAEQAARRDAGQAAAIARAQSKEIDNCPYCPGSSRWNAVSLIAAGTHWNVLTPRVGIAPHHVVLTPAEHLASLAAAPEDVLGELADWRVVLSRAAKSRGEEFIFMETAKGAPRHGHTSLVAVPVESEILEIDPSVYFTQELSGVESEFAQHRAVIQVPGGASGIPQALPKELPYFAVLFGENGGGLGHIIEEPGSWARDWDLQVACGILGEPMPRGKGGGRGTGRDTITAGLRRDIGLVTGARLGQEARARPANGTGKV